MEKSSLKFNLLARVLHWLMALMLITMLFLGALIMTSLTNRTWLIGIHKSVGIIIIILLIVRVINKIANPFPSLPDKKQSRIANIMHGIMYVLIFITPVIGWGMLSAGNFPIVIFGSIQLPPILPTSSYWYSILRYLHSLFAWMLLIIICGHIFMALLHQLVYKDSVLRSIIRGKKQ